MKKTVVVDFDNELAIFDLPEIEGLVLCPDIDKLEIINSFGPINVDDYMDLCKSSIIGIDFQTNRITIYKATSYTKNSTYNVALLQEKRSFLCKELNKHYKELRAVLLH